MIRRAVAMLILMGAGWFLLAPSSLGGPLSYVATHGSSMAPRIQTGDLAVVIRHGRYDVGDVIAYRSATLETIVLHRIVDMHDGRFVTKGDNNTWLDPDRPTAEDVLGSLILHVPHTGTVLQAARTPLFWTVLVAAVLLISIVTTTQRRKKLMLNPDRQPRVRPEVIALAGAGTAVLMAVLSVVGFFSYSAPAAAAQPSAPTVTWNYAATAPVSAAYPNGRLTTGDPIFLRLVRQLTVTARDDITGPLPSGALAARMETPSGWSANVPLGESTSEGVPAARIDLRALTARLDRMSAETGVDSSVGTLTVTARDATLRFAYDGTQLRADPATLTARAVPDVPQGTRGSALTTIADRLHPLRWITAVLAGLAAVAAAGALFIRGTHPPEARRRTTRGAVGADRVRIPGDRLVVELADAAEVRRMARRADRPMIHCETGQGSVLLVDDGDAVYRFRAPAAGGPDRAADRPHGTRAAARANQSLERRPVPVGPAR